MEPRDTTITGTVVRKRIAPGSKSDHIGVVLRDDKGQHYVLRRVGGHAFRDAALERLVGKTITGNGFVSGRTFIMSDWIVKD
jgi:hypothetical protein